MRVVALGRKSFLFVGHDEAGENLAIWYSLVASAEAIGIDPVAYIADLLMEVPGTPPKKYDGLLPYEWAKARGLLDDDGGPAGVEGPEP